MTKTTHDFPYAAPCSLGDLTGIGGVVCCFGGVNEIR